MAMTSNQRNRNMKIKCLPILVPLAVLAAGCGSAADTVSRNISKDAEQFRIERRIVGINSITDKVEFEVEGRCSIDPGIARSLVVTCKQGPHAYAKHYVGLADNVFFISTQVGTVDESEYHTKIILRPESITPGFDLVNGETP